MTSAHVSNAAVRLGVGMVSMPFALHSKRFDGNRGKDTQRAQQRASRTTERDGWRDRNDGGGSR